MDLLNFKPKEKFAQKHIIKLLDYSADEILTVLSLALKLKAEKKAGIPHPHLKGKTLAMIFLKIPRVHAFLLKPASINWAAWGFF